MKDKSILIVDDERRLADSARDLLKSDGFAAQSAYSGSEAIEKMREHAFPVVVTDLRMQGVDGLDLIRHLHQHHPKTLVIVVTGFASADSAIEALRYHAFDYIRKPFDFDHFKLAVQRAFDKLEMDQIREDTAAMITHDIKLPLTSIMGYASLLRNSETGEFHPHAAEYVETILSNGRKVLALIDNYLTSFRAETGNLVAHPVKTRIGEFVKSLLEIFGAEAKKRGFSIESSDAGAPDEMAMDEPLVFRAVGNLLQNAIKYGDPAQPIVMNLKGLLPAESPLATESLLIEVINGAFQLNSNELDGLFERFKRAAFSSGVEGSGIGLYVVNAVARAHGGVALARCLDRDRVAFSIILPLNPTVKP